MIEWNSWGNMFRSSVAAYVCMRVKILRVPDCSSTHTHMCSMQSNLTSCYWGGLVVSLYFLPGRRQSRKNTSIALHSNSTIILHFQRSSKYVAFPLREPVFHFTGYTPEEILKIKGEVDSFTLLCIVLGIWLVHLFFLALDQSDSSLDCLELENVTCCIRTKGHVRWLV